MTTILALIPGQVWAGIIAALVAVAGIFGFGQMKKREGRKEAADKANRDTLDAVRKRDKASREIEKESDDALVDRLTRR